MSNTDSGWRKRQIALEKMAENARELGLDYEPSKTVIEMATEAKLFAGPVFRDGLERFAELVRADEREACSKLAEKLTWADNMGVASAIRARSKT